MQIKYRLCPLPLGLSLLPGVLLAQGPSAPPLSALSRDPRPQLMTCEQPDGQEQTLALFSGELGPIPLSPIPPPPVRARGPSARRLVQVSEVGALNLIDSRRPYGWTYIVLSQDDAEAPLALASDLQGDLCGDALAEARALQFNLGHTLEVLYEVLGAEGWDEAQGAIVGEIALGGAGAAQFHKEGPYVSFPSRGATSYARDLTVVAHEVAHGLSFYRGGPGSGPGEPEGDEALALMESVADVIGVGVAKVSRAGVRPQAIEDWRFGEKVNADAHPLRDLKNPEASGGLDHADLLLCDDGGEERYLNSGIPSLAFVRMVEGAPEQGVDPLSPDFDESLTLALSLWGDALGQGLGEEATFADLSRALMAAAPYRELEASITQALESVGICPDRPEGCPPISGIEADSPLASWGEGPVRDMLLGEHVTRARPVDGDAAPDWFTTYSYTVDGDPGIFPLFVRGGVSVTPPAAGPRAPFDEPLCEDKDGKVRGQPIALGDLNGDGQAEVMLLLAGTSPQAPCEVAVLPGGDPARWDRPLLRIPVPGGRSLASGGELDGDGIEDLLILAAEKVFVLPGWGSAPAPGGPLPPPLITYPAGTTTSWASFIGDVNGDGFGDAHVSLGSDVASQLLLGGPGGIPSVIALPPASRAFPLGDLDGDPRGLNDFALTLTADNGPTGETPQAGALRIFLGAEDPGALSTFDDVVYGTRPESLLGRYVVGGDLDGDGQGELYVTDSGLDPKLRQGRVQRMVWSGQALVTTGALESSGPRAYLGRGLVIVPGSSPALFATAPGHRPPNPERGCRILEGGGIFPLPLQRFIPPPTR